MIDMALSTLGGIDFWGAKKIDDASGLFDWEALVTQLVSKEEIGREKRKAKRAYDRLRYRKKVEAENDQNHSPSSPVLHPSTSES